VQKGLLLAFKVLTASETILSQGKKLNEGSKETSSRDFVRSSHTLGPNEPLY